MAGGRLVHGVLFEEGQQEVKQRAVGRRRGGGAAGRPGEVPPAGRQLAMRVVERLAGQGHLLEVVRGPDAVRGLTNFLYGG